MESMRIEPVSIFALSLHTCILAGRFAGFAAFGFTTIFLALGIAGI
jgi:hypothetical protein